MRILHHPVGQKMEVLGNSRYTVPDVGRVGRVLAGKTILADISVPCPGFGRQGPM